MIARIDPPASHFGGSIAVGTSDAAGGPFTRGIALVPSDSGSPGFAVTSGAFGPGPGAGVTSLASATYPRVLAFGDDSNIGVGLATVMNGTIQDRYIANATPKTITDSGGGGPYSLFDVACAASSMVGGQLDYLVEASDGTDFQAQAGTVHWAAVNKAGTHTTSIVEDSTAFASAKSSGTLTLAWTLVTGANKVTAKLQPTGSLTETTPYRVTYTVRPIRGVVTLL